MSRESTKPTVSERLDSTEGPKEIWIEQDGYITLHLTPDEAEHIAHALPFDHELAVRIRHALRGPLTRTIVF